MRGFLGSFSEAAVLERPSSAPLPSQAILGRGSLLMEEPLRLAPAPATPAGPLWGLQSGDKSCPVPPPESAQIPTGWGQEGGWT